MSTGKLSALALSLILSSGVLWAQGARNKEVAITPSAESQAALVRHAFESELQAILEKYLKPHQYAVDVSFKMPQNLKGVGDVPYAPDSIIPESFQGLPNAEQLKKLQDLQVHVLVPQWMDAQTKTTLQNLLNKRLETLMGSAVRLEMQSVPLNVEEPPKPIPGTPAAIAAANPNAGQEVADLKAQMQKERDQFKEDLKDLQDKLAGSDKTNPITGVAASKNTFQDFWEFAKSNPIGAVVIVILIYAAVFLLAFLPSRSFTTGMGSLQNAYNTIAKSIKGMADTLARSSSGGGGGESSERPAAAAAAVPGLGHGAAAVSAHNKSQQLSYPELREILQHIQKQHQAHSDPIAIEMLQSFLTQNDQAFKAVLVLELLGHHHANRIFEQLPPDQKDQVLRLINQAESAAGDKTEALYELAEAYQTRILASTWKGGTRSALDEILQRNIGSLKPEDFPIVARQLKTEEGLRRLMLYLDAPALVLLLQSFKRQPQEKELVLKVLATMPEALDASHADREVNAVVDHFITQKREDRYLPYLNHFETIVASSGEDMEDDLIDQISRSNPNVGRLLRRKVVTIGSFFLLSDSARGELLGPFSNYELAVLVSAFGDDQKKAALLSCIEPRRRELVQEQLHMLVDENKYALAETQRTMKIRLKDALKVIRASAADDTAEASPETDTGASGAAA